MNDDLDTSAEACAVACMLVSNPAGETRHVGWQRQVNDLIRALRDERDALRAELAAAQNVAAVAEAYEDVWINEVERLRDELAAAKESVETAKTQRNIYQKQAHASLKERDALRELLREAKAFLPEPSRQLEKSALKTLHARIGALVETPASPE